MRPRRSIPIILGVLSASLLGLPSRVATGASDDRGIRFPTPPLLWRNDSDQAHAAFGDSVNTAGDVNGDGYDDVIVGASYYDNGQASEGAAFVYHGSSSGPSTIPAWMAEADQESAYFGESVNTAGDVNGDGFDDVIVGADDYEFGRTDEGAAFVYHGSASGLLLTPSWTAGGDQRFANFGGSVGTAGDVNADGFDDVIVGAYVSSKGQFSEGRAFVYHGSASGLSLVPAWTDESDQASAFFGRSVGTAGDVNGDGFDDVIVGADAYDNVQGTEGAAFVYHGSASGLSLTPSWRVASDQDEAEFGFLVNTAGDVNGDGFDEVIVGAYLYSNGQFEGGRAFVYQGSASGLSLTPGWTTEGDQVNAFFGYSAGTAGDVNTDGFDDVIVGAPTYDNPRVNGGGAFVYYGSASGLSLTPVLTAESQQYAHLGDSVGSAGDVNGDGFDDVIVGAYGFAHPQGGEGAAFVYGRRP